MSNCGAAFVSLLRTDPFGDPFGDFGGLAAAFGLTVTFICGRNLPRQVSK